MCRLIIVLAVGLLLANCQERPRIIETSYTEGKEYIYEYDSQVLSGLPIGAKTYSGLKLKSQVLIQVVSLWKVKLQLKSPRLYKVNDLLDTYDPTKEMLPTELFKELLEHEVEDMKVHLSKPVVISYVRGHVEDLRTEDEDPEWSVNIKRGVLSLLEMNFNERQSLSKDVPVRTSDDKPKVYKVIEPSVVGECETRYRIEPERSSEDVPSMRIHKMRDYGRCLERVVLSQDVLNSRPCDASPELKDPLSAESSVRYHLLGTPDQFIILSAVSESQYSFTPYSPEAGSLATVSNQTLTLVDSRPITDPISEPKSPLDHERPLKVKSPDSDSSLLSLRTLKMNKEDKVELWKMVEKVLTGIEHLMKEKVDEEVGELISELTRLLKKLDKQTLDLILDDVLKSSMKMPKARKVVLDILPSVGTYPAVDVLLERIEKGDIPRKSAPLALMTLSLLPKPDVFMVQRIMDYLEERHSHPKVEDTMLCRSAWLTLGSLGDKMNHVSAAAIKELESEKKVMEELQSESNDQQTRKKLYMRLEKIKIKHHQIKELYTTAKDKIIKLVEKLHKRDDKDSQRLAVKVMTNLRYEDFAPGLETIVKDYKKPEQMRIDALDSLRQILKASPEKVVKIFLPLSLDRKQPDVIRMMAISVVATTSRHSSPIEMIVRSLEDDPNDNVGHYVYSLLAELSKLSTPCDGLKELAQNSSLPKRYAQERPKSHLKSSLHARSTYDEKLRIGHSYTSAFLYSPKEWTPSYLAVKYTAYLLGKTLDIVEVTYSGKGMDSVLDKLLMVSTDTSLETILKTILHPRQKRSTPTSYEHAIKDIKEKLGVKPKLLEELQGSIGLKVFDKELIYLDTSSLLYHLVESDLDSKPIYLERLKDKLSLVESLKDMLKTQKTLALPLLHSTVPTEIGLPLKLYIDKQTSLKFDGELKLKSDPRSSKKKSLIGKMDALMKVRPSGLIEIKGRMEVEMQHIRSGVSVKGKVYSDIPLTLSVNMDPNSFKLLIKIKDERELTLAKIKSNVHTEVRQLPSTVEEYPLPPERKEIKVVDGADLKMVSYEIGKDVLGRSVKIQGMRSVRKDSLVPLPPMSGRQMIHVKYEPHVNTGLDIQIQHVTDSDLPKDENDHSRKSSSWLSLGSWFSQSSKDKEPDSFFDSREELPESGDADKFLDLELKDLTISHLKDKFTKETEILKSGSKCGLVLRIADSNPEPKRQVQLSTLYQGDHFHRKVKYTVELKRTPVLREEKPWKMVTDIRLDLPEQIMEPSDLLDIEYQKQVHEQIRITVTEDGKYLDSLLDIGTAVVTKSAKHLKKLYKPDSLDLVIEDSLNHVIQNSEGKESKPLNDAVQKQRKILRDITKLSKQPADPEKVKSQLETLKKLLKQCKSETDKVSLRLHQTPRSNQAPDDSVKVLYIVVIKEKADRILHKIVKKLQPLLLLSERKELETKLKMHELDLERIKEHQRMHSMDKQSSELQKSRIEIEPEDRRLHAMLLGLEEKLITLSKKKSDDPKEKVTRKSIESRLRQIREIDEESKDVREKLDDTMLEKSKLNRMLRVKVLEVLLHQKLSLLYINKDIKFLEKKERTTDARSFKTPDVNLDENMKKELVKLKEDLLRKSQAISRMLIIAINVEKERKSSDVHIRPIDEDKLVALVKVEVKHLKVLESLHVKDPSQVSNMRREPSKESLERSLDEVKETNRQVMDIVDQELLDIKSERKPLLSAVLIKCLKSLSQQSVILDKVNRIIKDRIILEEVQDGPVLISLKKLKLDLEPLLHDTFRNVLKIEQHLKKRDLSVPDTYLNDLPSLTSYLIKEKTSGVAVLLKKTLKVEVHHSEVRPLLRKLLLSLDAPTPSERLSKVSKNVQEKRLLYDIISKLLSSQDELDMILKPLEQTVKVDHNSDLMSNLLQVVTEKLDHQLKLVKTVEKKLIDMSHSDLSLLQPLQTIQQLKDRVQRQQHRTKMLQESSSSLSRDSPSSPRSHHTLSLSKSVLPSHKQHMYMGVVKVKYGMVDTDSKMITLRLFGKKSLQQLLWEQDQSLPSKQDPALLRYLSDKLQPDDPTATDYKTIKDKINTYRHLHALLAYEESLPSYARELVWKLHELLKLKLHDKLELLMPDDTNLKNQLEVKMELSSDDKLMDVEIKTPSETSRLKHIPMPDIVKRVSLLDSVEGTVLSALGSRLRPATCHVTPDRVRMLTEKTVEVDLRSLPCESVLTLDCSPDSSLAITSKPHPQDSSRKILTILTKERKVEIIPDPIKMEVKVDGKPLSLPDTARLDKDSPSPVVVRVIREDLVEVKLPDLGLSVTSDGKTVSVKVPLTYWSKLCGICSSLDIKPEVHLGPHQVQYRDPQQFVSTYLIPDNKCDPLPVQNSLGVPEIREKAKQIKPVEVTLLKETKRNGIHRTCFSIRPVKKCPPMSRPHGIIEHLVHFYCLRSSSPKAERYRELSHSRVLDEIMDKETDMNENIPMPNYCSNL